MYKRQALAGEGVPGPEQGQSRPGCVTIMTVHRSKGLEFPVVFAADLGREFNKEDLRAAAVFHPQLGIGLTLRAGLSLIHISPTPSGKA